MNVSSSLRRRLTRVALCLLYVFTVGVSLGAPARADNETTYDRCREDSFVVHYVAYPGGPVLDKAIHYTGSSGLLPANIKRGSSGAADAATAVALFPAYILAKLLDGGPTAIPWDCNGPSHDFTRCARDTAAFKITRTGQPQFRIDCFDALTAKGMGFVDGTRPTPKPSATPSPAIDPSVLIKPPPAFPTPAPSPTLQVHPL